MLTNDELFRKNWWNDLKPHEQEQARKAGGGKPGEAGIIDAWNHHKNLKEAERNRHPSMEVPIKK